MLGHKSEPIKYQYIFGMEELRKDIFDLTQVLRNQNDNLNGLRDQLIRMSSQLHDLENIKNALTEDVGLRDLIRQAINRAIGGHTIEDAVTQALKNAKD